MNCEEVDEAPRRYLEHYLHVIPMPITGGGCILDAGWYFEDEGGELCGPYATREEAVEALTNYMRSLEADAP